MSNIGKPPKKHNICTSIHFNNHATLPSTLSTRPPRTLFSIKTAYVDNQDVEEILKEFAPHNLSLSNHQPQKTQKQHHGNKLISPNKLAKYQQSKKGRKNKQNKWKNAQGKEMPKTQFGTISPPP
jgi:hypothetical protein